MKKRWVQWACAAVIVVAVHDLMLVLGCWMAHGSLEMDTFVAMVWERLTMPGDAQRYIQIAKDGYVTEGPDAINLVFYPLYPLLIRIFSFGRFELSIVGMVISRLSLMGAGVCLYELVRQDHGEKTAAGSVWLLAVYPFSMFTVGVYTESLFLLLTIGCMLSIRKGNMLLAGIIGFLASLTRVQGMLLIFPAVYRIVGEWLGPKKQKMRFRDAAVLLIPLGFAVYLFINYHLYGNAFQFMAFEEGDPWYQSTRWVGDNLAQQYRNALEFEGLDMIIYWPQILLYFGAIFILLLGIRQKIRMEYLLYGAVYLGFTYLSGWMISGGRYMLCCFPVYMVLACMENEKVKAAVAALSGALFAAFSCFFLQGYAIM